MRTAVSLVLGLVGLASTVRADPTWPNDFDDFEEIMYQVFGSRARSFADMVFPCNNEPTPGRFNSAEWLRTGFHDMATGNTFFGTGGLDASLQYEIDNEENGGPAFNNTLTFMSPFFNKKTSLADLIALGVYTAVRSCQGPIVPVRYGRLDAIARGPTGVPEVQNNVFTFQQQFQRMGFNPTEMIQLVACGHSIGGVHSDPNSRIVPPGTLEKDVGPLDSTPDVYDSHVVTDYLDESTPNPLVTGPSVTLGHHSDFRIFSSDGNATVRAMASDSAFQRVCQGVLGRMIDVVPSGISLTAPVKPYDVKPGNLQLLLDTDGETLQLTGHIRVRTTELPQSSIEGLTITYQDRFGGSECGGSCSFTVTQDGVGTGFDEAFAFFPINHSIPASSGISSFTVSIKMAGGATIHHDNNGKLYPVQDAIIFQKQESCLQSSGALILTAAVRNDVAENPISASIAYKTPQTNSPVPRLRKMTLELTKGNCRGEYTLFSVNITIPGGLISESTVDITGGDYAEEFRRVDELEENCEPLEGSDECSVVDPPVSSSASVPATRSDSVTSITASGTVTSHPGSGTAPSPPSGTVTSVSGSATATSASESQPGASDTPSEPATSRSGDAGTPSDITSTTPRSETITSASPDSSSSMATPTGPHHRPTMGGYELVSCWRDDAGARALGDAFFAYDEMTLESCMANCTGYNYWGTEYGRECWCGDVLRVSSTEAPLADCDMTCAGDDTQFCGSGNRLELYSTTATVTSASPTATLVHPSNVGDYSLVGCWKEGIGARALGAKATAAADMTLDKCAGYCSDYRYFGAEYANECYCGNVLHGTSEEAQLDDCDMACSGNQYQYCGSGNRLSLYLDDKKEIFEPRHPPTIGSYEFLGCRTEVLGARALPGAILARKKMTNSMCADFCDGSTFFGTEYGGECFCGNVLDEESEEVNKSECGMVCGGASTEFCGDANRLSVYKLKEDDGV